MSDDYDWTPHLQEGEEVLWQGRPDGRLVPFQVLIDFVVVPIGTAVSIGCPIVFGLAALDADEFVGAETIAAIVFGILFFFAGLFLAFARQTRDLVHRSNLRYAITSKRILRLNMKPGGALCFQELNPGMVIDDVRFLTSTIRVGPWVNESGKAISLDAEKSSLPVTAPPSEGGLPSGFRNPLLFNSQGYDELGFETRMLEEHGQVLELLRKHRAIQAATAP